MTYQQHFDRSVELRQEFWGKLGTVHPDVMTHIINPGLMGGPVWPSVRQAFLKIDTPEGTIIASDGLSDPYSDFDSNPNNQTYNGVGCEFYIECNEVIADFNELKSAWQFHMVYQAAQLAAGNPNISSMFDEYTYISTELYDCHVPKEFENEHKRAGVIMGLPSTLVPAKLDLSLEAVRFVNVKLLTLKELNHINQNHEKGRDAIAELMQKQDKTGKSFLERKSVV